MATLVHGRFECFVGRLTNYLSLFGWAELIAISKSSFITPNSSYHSIVVSLLVIPLSRCWKESLKSLSVSVKISLLKGIFEKILVRCSTISAQQGPIAEHNRIIPLYLTPLFTCILVRLWANLCSTSFPL